MKIAISLFAAANAGLSVDVEKPVTPRSRGVTYCMGCAAADDGQFPWQVSLQVRAQQTSGLSHFKELVWSPYYGRPLSQFKVGTSHFCGGSVLSATKVASAAHCYQTSFNIMAGSVDNQAGQTVAGASFLQHPAYDSQNILNDFAVATAATPFTLNDYLQPISLVAPSNNRKGSLTMTIKRPAEGTQLFTSGFGYFQKGPLGRPVREVSRYLLFTETFYVSVATCQSIWTGQTINDSIVCADKDGTSVCSGDSGGPLVIMEDGEWRLLGAVSWGQAFCNEQGMPQAWANIQAPQYNEWMRTNAGL